MNEILLNWGLADLTVTPIDSPSKSTWDIGGRYILKHYSNTDELSRSLLFSKLLSNEGIPVATFMPTVNGQFSTPEGLYCMMTKLSGNHVDFYENPTLACEIGRELAQLHNALARIETQTVCFDSDLLNDWNNYIKPNLSGIASEGMIKHIDILFTELHPSLPRQLIHRDVHCHNVLFDGNQLTGWLDFDLGHRNVRLFDIAYLLAGILVGEQHNPDRVKIWRSLYCDVISGYDEKRPLITMEHEALPVLMIVIELLFVSFWKQRKNREQCVKALNLAEWLYGEFMSQA